MLPLWLWQQQLPYVPPLHTAVLFTSLSDVTVSQAVISEDPVLSSSLPPPREGLFQNLSSRMPGALGRCLHPQGASGCKFPLCNNITSITAINCSIFNYLRLHQVCVCTRYQLCHNKWISFSRSPLVDGWASVPPWLFWLWTGLFSCCLLSPTEKNNSFWSAFYGLLGTGGPHYSFGQWLTRVKTNYTRLSWCWRRNEPTSLRL